MEKPVVCGKLSGKDRVCIEMRTQNAECSRRESMLISFGLALAEGG